MWLKVPENSEKTLWAGALEVDEADFDRVQRSSQDKLDKDTAQRFIRNLPIVSIGNPEVWPLASVYPLDQMPLILRSKVEEANFFLVRLSCSFRPRIDGPQVDWARFQVSLLPDQANQVPVAFDLYPPRVVKELKQNTKVTLSPAVKFQEVEVSVGAIEFGFEYTEVEPIISATGVGESAPSWDYQAVKGERIQGSKWMYLLIKAAREMTSGFATLDLTSDVVKEGFRLPVFIKPKIAIADPLTIQLWGG